MLLSHANAVNQIKVREGYHSDCVIIHYERQAIAELAHVDEVTDASYCRGQSILLYFAFQ